MFVGKISNTKPSVFFVLYCSVIFYVFLYQFFVFETPFWFLPINTILVFLNFFFINRMARINEIGKTNYYALFFSASFFVLFPKIFTNLSFFIAYTLLLWAFDKLFLVRYQGNEKEDLFVASLLISLAGILFNWGYLHFLSVLISVFLYTSGQLRNVWIIPISFVTVLFLCFNLFLLLNKIEFLLELFSFKVSFFDLSKIKWSFIISLVFIFFSFVFAWVFHSKKSSKQALFPSIMYVFLLVNILICMLNSRAFSTEIQLFHMPFSLFLAAFFERMYVLKQKEFLMWSFFVISILVFCSYFFNI